MQGPVFCPSPGVRPFAKVTRSLRPGWRRPGPNAAGDGRDRADGLGDDLLAVATKSATAALHLAPEGPGIGPDDELIVPTHTVTAAAEGPRDLRARPVRVPAAHRAQGRTTAPSHMPPIRAWPGGGR